MVKPQQEGAPAGPLGGDGQEVEFGDANRQPDVAEAAGPPDGDDAPPAKARWSPALLDGVRATEEQIDTDRFLAENIKDDQKFLPRLPRCLPNRVLTWQNTRDAGQRKAPVPSVGRSLLPSGLVRRGSFAFRTFLAAIKAVWRSAKLLSTASASSAVPPQA